jgi:hypothetical protein
MNPVILYRNILAQGALSVAGGDTAPGSDVLFLTEDRTFTDWAGDGPGTYYINLAAETALRADALGLAAHNLATVGGSVTVEISADGETWTPRTAAKSPVADGVFLALFVPVAALFWRLKIVAPDGAPRISVAYLGERLQFPYPPESPYTPFERTAKASTELSVKGHRLGTTLNYVTIAVKPKFKTLPRDFAFGDFLTFWETHAELYLHYFYAWDLDVYPQFVFFLRNRDSAKVAIPVSVLTLADSIEIDMEGLKL